MKKLAALLLAGGASTRMGQPKAFLPYQGMPLWKHQMKTLLALEPSELFISAARQIDFGTGPWKTLYDREPGLGPLAGLEAALKETAAGHLLVLAVDMPGFTADFFRVLLDEADESGIVAKIDGFYQGTAAIYTKSILPMVEVVLASEDRSFQHLAGHAIAAGLLKVHHATEQERPFFQNLNTPSDLAKGPV
jgi:molybdopterin-guanine dinucleotide biosynthesis protein A